MNNYKEVRLKRLYNGIASIRDYIWERLVKSDMGICFRCNGAVMYVEPWEVKQAVPGSHTFVSKYDKTPYRLVDFTWRSDRQKRMI